MPQIDYVQHQRAAVLDLLHSGISVDDIQRLTPEPRHPMPGFRVTDLEAEDRAQEILSFRESNSTRFHFPGKAAQSRMLWLSVAARCEPKWRRFHAMLMCGCSTMLERSASTDQWRISSPSCGNRFCPRCSRMIARERIRKVQALVDAPSQRGLKFVTISPEHVDWPLHEQLDHLTASFRRLRQQRIWADNAIHGCCVIEVHISRDGLWHPHLHIIADMHYIPQADLLDAARVATGRECSVFIEAVRNAAEAVNYVHKYVSKGCTKERTLRERPGAAEELYCAMYRRKSCWSWGKTAPKPPEPERKRKKATDWTPSLSFNQIVLAVRCRSKEVIAILKAAGAPLKSIAAYAAKRGDICQDDQPHAPPVAGKGGVISLTGDATSDSIVARRVAALAKALNHPDAPMH
jgi:hypothetical protein